VHYPDGGGPGEQQRVEKPQREEEPGTVVLFPRKAAALINGEFDH
jgi:hypothetical protein